MALTVVAFVSRLVEKTDRPIASRKFEKNVSIRQNSTLHLEAAMVG